MQDAQSMAMVRAQAPAPGRGSADPAARGCDGHRADDTSPPRSSGRRQGGGQTGALWECSKTPRGGTPRLCSSVAEAALPP